MKKILCVLVFTCLVFSAAFAQQRPPATPTPAPSQPAKPATPPPAAPAPAGSSIAFGLDLFQLFKGFIASDSDKKLYYFIISGGFENLIAPNFSIGADLDLYLMKFDKTDGLYFSLAGEGRYYPMSANFEKFFLGTTLGFNLLSIDGKTKPADGGFVGLITSLKMGYKVILSNNMYLEPSLAYVLSKSSELSQLGALFGGLGLPAVPTPLGWNGGLRLGFLMQ
jgi:hypothetical protein